jgi:hypothetical protein
MICITPRAPTGERMACCQPLSCHATARTSAGSTPCRAALAAIRPGTTAGSTQPGTGGSPEGASAGAFAAPGASSSAPATIWFGFASPLALASAPALTPSLAAIPERVSPGRTRYEVTVVTGVCATASSAACAPGTASSRPAAIRLGLARRLARASRPVLTPSLAAIPESVSPAFTR